ncbi:cation-transporting P-type ATPase [Streptomyces sp. NPDC059104]|uniref:cation-transporting P-type ATPase n=1 Tax=Streptomyces sp. NPDC059104 TaxID=3346729 RepID=UPI0036A02C0C
MPARASGTLPVGSSTPRGLTQDEAARRLARYGRNEVSPPRPTPLHRRVPARLRDPLIMVLLGAAPLTIAIGDHPDAPRAERLVGRMVVAAPDEGGGRHSPGAAGAPGSTIAVPVTSVATVRPPRWSSGREEALGGDGAVQLHPDVHDTLDRADRPCEQGDQGPVR